MNENASGLHVAHGEFEGGLVSAVNDFGADDFDDVKPFNRKIGKSEGVVGEFGGEGADIGIAVPVTDDLVFDKWCSHKVKILAYPKMWSIWLQTR